MGLLENLVTPAVAQERPLDGSPGICPCGRLSIRPEPLGRVTLKDEVVRAADATP